MMRLNLDGLADASREALMSDWREVVGRPPPKHLSKTLMGCCQTNRLKHQKSWETLVGIENVKRIRGFVVTMTSL